MNELVDFHTHILPALDHGSKNIEETANQVALLMEGNIDEVVCTSHFYGHVHNIHDFLEQRSKSASLLETYIAENNIDFRFHLGAEVLAFAGMENIERLSELAIGNSKTLLIELPYGPLPQNVESSVVRLMRNGFDILLAHADRYDEIDIEKLISAGAKVQLNASALCKFFVKGTYMRWIREGYCVAIGSDIHGADLKAVKKFQKTMKKIQKYKQYFTNYAKKVLQ